MTMPNEQRGGTLFIEGWKIGFNKVAFTKMLQQELHFSLTVAKGMTDQILEGRKLAVNVPGNIPDLDIKRINSIAQSLGAIIRNSAPVSAVGEDSCQ